MPLLMVILPGVYLGPRKLPDELFNGNSGGIQINVQASNLSLAFGLEAESGKVARLLGPFDVKEAVGHRRVVRIRNEGDCLIPHRSLMSLDCNPSRDPGARELLDDAGQADWGRWISPPNIEF